MILSAVILNDELPSDFNFMAYDLQRSVTVHCLRNSCKKLADLSELGTWQNFLHTGGQLIFTPNIDHTNNAAQHYKC